jgi:hypothetical protein
VPKIHPSVRGELRRLDERQRPKAAQALASICWCQGGPEARLRVGSAQGHPCSSTHLQTARAGLARSARPRRHPDRPRTS